MDFTNMTMEELNQMDTELWKEINRRKKIEAEKATKEFMDAFVKARKIAISITYDGWDKTYELTDPERFHFQPL